MILKAGIYSFVNQPSKYFTDEEGQGQEITLNIPWESMNSEMTSGDGFIIKQSIYSSGGTSGTIYKNILLGKNVPFTYNGTTSLIDVELFDTHYNGNPVWSNPQGYPLIFKVVNDTTLEERGGEWFTTNTIPLAEIEAGTYTINNDISFEGLEDGEAYPFRFTNDNIVYGLIGYAEGQLVYLSDDFNTMTVAYEGGFVDSKYQLLEVGENAYIHPTLKEWVITHTTKEEEKPLVEITYNGETIAQLNAGETATLSCEGKKMASDVVVKVNEVESKIPEGYVKPEGSLSITENGTYPVTDKEEVVVNVPIPDGYIKPEGTLELVFNNIEAEFPIDCSQYAKVTVNTAEPLKITDPTVLDNITDSPYGVGGSVFLYEGATTDSYEKGALYYLEDPDK